MKVWIACQGPEFGLLGIYQSLEGAQLRCEKVSDGATWFQDSPGHFLLLESDDEDDYRYWVEEMAVYP